MKYYRVKVKLKNGFEYSYTCIHRMLEGMMQSSRSYWTESVTSEEINEEDFRKTREVTFEEDKVLRKAIVKSGKVVDKGKLLAPKGKLIEKPVEKNSVAKKNNPKFSSLENFFESSEGAPENKKVKKRV
jgi:hypothetical protein